MPAFAGMTPGGEWRARQQKYLVPRHSGGALDGLSLPAQLVHNRLPKTYHLADDFLLGNVEL